MSAGLREWAERTLIETEPPPDSRPSWIFSAYVGVSTLGIALNDLRRRDFTSCARYLGYAKREFAWAIMECPGLASPLLPKGTTAR